MFILFMSSAADLMVRVRPFVLDRDQPHQCAAGGKCDGKKEETHPDEGSIPPWR
jgi:hypothetical protein